MIEEKTKKKKTNKLWFGFWFSFQFNFDLKTEQQQKLQAIVTKSSESLFLHFILLYFNHFFLSFLLLYGHLKH